ncbi:MAG: peptidase U32 [Desulfuromonas sp.]|uniref:peptidase U32 family protein n=1 Tax=Desulfuromonas sp. TaxID=892 RepID=UPI000CB06D5C|nr:U32 family peptidase [Desulfuromonas sp.]PLX86619.1 MAG: peptidase U32 [Desulfuromonas sp.]
MSRPELLVPAGDMEKLETALDYGADAVYLGGEHFGLRANAGNFDLAGLARARELTLARGRRLYLTLNAYLRPCEAASLASYLEELRPLGLDAYIVSDPGVLELVREVDPGREIHLSTQANTTNAGAARFWQRAGVRRINLARELTLEEIRSIRSATDMELEVFVHGAMCVAYSGRCLLSAALVGRSANEGGCAHPCRWGYALVEETRPGEYFPVEEDARGTYILNSRDLCLLERLPELVGAGLDSLKIEGRMKSRYYVAAVTRVYRAALDRYLADPEAYRPEPDWVGELERVSHRPYGTGFLFGGRDDAGVQSGDARYRRSHDFVGVVRSVDGQGRGTVEGRNRFFPGETLELIGPGMRQASFPVEEVFAGGGEPLQVVQPNARAVMALPPGARPGDLLRREAAG